MGRILRTAEAELDLVEIWLHISEDDRHAADRLWNTLDQKFRLLSDFTGLGQAREELGPSVRSFPVGSYLIFYRPLPTALLRVVHGARDVRRLFRRASDSA